MRLKMHRGAHQLGGNIIEVATDTAKIILDCGRNLPPLDIEYLHASGYAYREPHGNVPSLNDGKMLEL